MSEISGSSRIVARESALATTVDGEAVVLETDSGTYFGLNEVATIVWDALEEPSTVDDVRDAVLEEYDVDAEQVERDVRDVLSKMEAKGLVDAEAPE